MAHIGRIATAAHDNEFDVVLQLIDDGCDVNERDQYGGTALGYALAAHNGDAVRTLVQHGADVNARDNENRTPLFYSVFWFCPTWMVQLCLEHGGDTSMCDVRGVTPLMMAELQQVETGSPRTDVIELLRKRSAEAPETVPEEAMKKDYFYINGRIELAIALNEENEPAEFLEMFSGNISEMIVYVYWFGLTPNLEYDFFWKLYGPNGFLSQANLKFTPTAERYNTWGMYQLDPRKDKPGKWRFEIYLDTHKMGERDFYVEL